jgi:hypothetical protein
MLQCGRLVSGRGIAGILAAAALVVQAGAGAQELRTVLATGDDVPGLGRIGLWGLRLVVLDDAGRALVSRVDGEREESVWADGDRFTPLIDPTAGDGIELAGYELVGSRAGTVTGLGFRRSEGVTWADAMYSVVGGRLTEIARVGDRDREGYTFCELHTPVVNAGGASAFSAFVVPPSYACPDLDGDGDSTPVYEGLYLADGELRRIGGTGALSPPGWDERSFNLLALSDAGEAIVQVADGGGQRVLAVGTDGVRVLYRVGDADGPGVIGRGREYGFDILAANGTGMVLFRRLVREQAGIYRAAGGQIQPVVLEDDPAPWGDTYSTGHAYAWPSSFNDRGDVLLVFNDDRRAVLYPADGTPRVFPGRIATGSVNNRGDVALVAHSTDESFEIVRYRGGEVRRLAGTGDRLPGGGVLAARGLGAACLAPNGAIAVTAWTTNGDTALVCGDGNGFAPVSRMGDGRPDGRRFYSFDRCAFAGPEELLFIGTGLAPSGKPREYFSQRAVYRASADRLERVLGPGDELADGSRITWLPSAWSSIFDADPSGRVLTLALTDDAGRAVLVIAHADGRRERLPLRLRNSAQLNERIAFAPDSSVDHEYLAGLRNEPAASAAPPLGALRASATDPYYDIGAVWVSYASLAASGGVFVLGSEAIPHPEYGIDDRAVLLYVADGAVQQIAAEGEIVADGPFGRFEMLRAKGDRIAFQARTAAGLAIFTYALGDAAPSAVVRAGDSSPAGTLRWPWPLAITDGGDVYFLDTPESASQPIVFASENGAIRVIGPVDAGNVWWADTSDAGALLVPTDGSLRLAGPGAGAATCPHPATIVPPTLVPLPPPPGATPPPASELPFEPAPCIPGTVCLYVGSAAARPGARAQVDVYLRTNGQAVAATQNDLRFPPLAPVTQCVGNEAIGKEGTAFSITDERTRAIVISLANTDPIADGVRLYSCDIAIPADAAPGRYPLSCSDPGSAAPPGVALSTSCADGVLTVTATESGGAAQSIASRSNGGCAIQPGAGTPAWLVLLGALVAAGAARPRSPRTSPK